MYHAKEIRWLIFLPSLLVLAALVVTYLWEPAPLSGNGEVCLGLPVVSPSDIHETEACTKNYAGYFLFNGEKAAADIDSRTLYLPQQILESTTREALTGQLSISVSNCRLYFLEDPAFDNLAEAVAQGHPFPLAATHGTHCHLYNVIFTTLPVLRMDHVSKQAQENGFPLFSGKMYLWEPGHEEPISSDLLFKARGNTVLYMSKQSWKLSLKTNRMKNNHLSLAGLGTDDDWILNSMSMDDTKLKDMFFSQVWNSIAQDSAWDYPTASCRYVEVVLDGSYYGVYLLQRRVDQKYLDLSDDDILIKGTGLWTTSVPQESYEIKYSPLPDAETLALMEGVYDLSDVSMLNIDNFLDVNLLLQLGPLADNTGYKNMYYCLRKEASGYRLSMIPWDTDMSLGVIYSNGFVYDYDASLRMTVLRREYSQMSALYPDLEERMGARWRQLRQSVLATDNLIRQLESQIQVLSQSGAYARDGQRWEPYHGGMDTQESALRFVRERLALLDDRYR